MATVMDDFFRGSLATLRPHQAKRLVLVVTLSVLAHIAVLAWLPSVQTDLPRRWNGGSTFEIILDRAAADVMSIRKAPPVLRRRPATGDAKQEPPVRWELGLDNPLTPALPRTRESDTTRAPEVEALGRARGGNTDRRADDRSALSGSIARIETPHGIMESHKVAGGTTAVRYVFKDGSVRCFVLRDPDPGNTFDFGSVLAGRRC